jgi:hypothetical protein
MTKTMTGTNRTNGPVGRRRQLVALAVGLVAVAACGGGSKTASTSSTAAITTTSTAKPTTTTALTTSTTTAATTTTAAPGPTFPFTGLPAPDPAKLNRAAFVIKINNDPEANPQNGINQADLVFEERIGPADTRFLSVFQSTDAEKIGSIRSVRASDLHIIPALSTPLVAFSGGNQNLLPVVARTDLIDASANAHPELYTYGRHMTRYNEYFTSSEAVWSVAPAGKGAPAPISTFRPAGQPMPGGTAATHLHWGAESYNIDWSWDAASSTWKRDMRGAPHVDTDGVQVSAANVVAMFVAYRSAFDDPRSPEAVTVGTGEAWVLSGGAVVKGTWERADDHAPFVFKDASGKVIDLAPGRTWFELADPGKVEVA